MKITTLIFIFLIPLSQFAQMEFEEVFDLETERRIMDIKDVHFFSDSILIIAETYLVNETQRRYNYFLSPDNGNTWNIITDKLLKNHSQIRQDKPIGKYQVGRGTFVRFNLPEKDTSISFIDLEGNIKSKIPYPFIGTRMEFSDLLLNPLDENFIGIHHNYYEFQVDTYFHNIGYTTNLGENWNSIQPELQLLEKEGVAVSKNRKISPYLSLTRKNSMLIFFEWSSRSDFYSIDAYYDMNENEFTFMHLKEINARFLCFECLKLESINYISEDRSGVLNYNLKNGQVEQILDGYQILNVDKDSLTKLDEKVTIGASTSEYSSTLKTSSTNPNIQVLRVNLRAEDFNELFNQHLFKTTDGGKKWEFIYSNNGLLEPITDFGILSQDSRVWLVKARNINGIESEYKLDYHKVLLSKKTLSSIETHSDLIYSTYLNNNTLIISSLEPKNNSKITVYNLQGKEIYSNSHDLVKGENQIGLNQILNNGMYLVKITSNVNESLVFKLLRVE